jgi:hypothetical protein
MQLRKFSALGVCAAFLVSIPGRSEPVKTEAVITSVAGDTIQARTRTGSLTVVLTPTTKIAQTSGKLAKKSTRPASSLIPGLIISVEGDQQGETVTAEDIRFKEKDWRSAVATKAGTQEQFAELRQAIIDGQEYVIRQESTVYFPRGARWSARPTSRTCASWRRRRHPTAITASRSWDSRTRAAIPPRTSASARNARRAVNNYLRQTGMIQPGRVLSPSAMGEGTTAPGEAAPTSHDEARRVVVRVVTPKSQLTN